MRSSTMRSSASSFSRRALAITCCVASLYVRCVQGATYYLDQRSGNDDNDGLSTSAAFAGVKAATKILKPGDELRIVGALSNPSYDPTYTFRGDVSDAHLWHGENTLRISDLHGTADAWINITSHDPKTTVLRGDGGNIIRVQKSSYIRFTRLNVHGEVDRIPTATAKALQFVYKDDAGAVQYRVDTSLTDEQIGELQLPKIGGNVPRASYTDTRGARPFLFTPHLLTTRRLNTVYVYFVSFTHQCDMNGVLRFSPSALNAHLPRHQLPMKSLKSSEKPKTRVCV